MSHTTHDTSIADFLSYLQDERGLSSNTIKAYSNDIQELYSFVMDERQAGNALSWPPKKSDLESYVNRLHASKLQLSSQARKLIAIKVFLRFLFREEYIDQNISKCIETPRKWQRIPSILDYEEIERLLEAPNLSEEAGIRDKAIFEILYGTGVRVSELCNLSLYDVSDTTIRVFGKGGKERLVPIGKKALLAVDYYLHTVRSKYDSTKNTSLFVTTRGKKITREFVWRQVQRYARQLGIEKRVSPHLFRHTYASHLLDGGADVRVIQDLLGHAHISSTDRYTHVSKTQIQEAFHAFHPRWDDG